MGLNETPSAERIQIGFFGRRNAGKSSVLNAVTGQSLAVVSDVKGTTTDPVYKSMELLPIGSVVLIDTPGIDDEGELGLMRIQKSRQVLNKTDAAVLVADGSCPLGCEEEELIRLFRQKSIPYLIVRNKRDLFPAQEAEEDELWISAKTGDGIDKLKERLAAMLASKAPSKPIAGDLVNPLDLVVLVVPIDASAPKGRLILPQQQTIRDLLEAGAVPVVVKDSEFKEALIKLGNRPRLVITDSQVFEAVSRDTPKDIWLTSFSILFARYKGSLAQSVDGLSALETLKDGDQILIAEGCTHHRQCGDIGSVKIPRWIKEHTGQTAKFTFVSGTEFPEDLTPYHMVIHCGGCMVNEREMKYRLSCAKEQGVPMTNYGILIASLKGILERSLEPFGSRFQA